MKTFESKKKQKARCGDALLSLRKKDCKFEASLHSEPISKKTNTRKEMKKIKRICDQITILKILKGYLTQRL
jgi:hypothetical protein